MADIYDDLCERILRAQEELLKHEVEANTVVLNGKKYAKLMKPGYRPTIFGMALEVDRMLPDDWDFIVQYREPEPATNADRLRSMSDDELAKELGWIVQDAFLYGAGERIGMKRYPFDNYESTLNWLRSPVGGDGDE